MCGVCGSTGDIERTPLPVGRRIGSSGSKARKTEQFLPVGESRHLGDALGIGELVYRLL